MSSTPRHVAPRRAVSWRCCSRIVGTVAGASRGFSCLLLVRLLGWLADRSFDAPVSRCHVARRLQRPPVSVTFSASVPSPRLTSSSSSSCLSCLYRATAGPLRNAQMGRRADEQASERASERASKRRFTLSCCSSPFVNGTLSGRSQAATEEEKKTQKGESATALQPTQSTFGLASRRSS